MRGILSTTPSPASARLAVGALLLLLNQLLLVALCAPALEGMLLMTVACSVLAAIAALIAAIRGESPSEAPRWWRRRHAP